MSAASPLSSTATTASAHPVVTTLRRLLDSAPLTAHKRLTRARRTLSASRSRRPPPPPPASCSTDRDCPQQRASGKRQDGRRYGPPDLPSPMPPALEARSPPATRPRSRTFAPPPLRAQQGYHRALPTPRSQHARGAAAHRAAAPQSPGCQLRPATITILDYLAGAGGSSSGPSGGPGIDHGARMKKKLWTSSRMASTWSVKKAVI